MEANARWLVVASPEKKNSGFFAIIFGFFRIFILPSAFPALGEVFAECPTKNTRQSLFADKNSPSVTLGKPFAECFLGFAECQGHSANLLIPVVYVPKILNGTITR